MGLSIHYRGQLDDIARIHALSAELTDIADAMGWHSTKLDDDWGEPAKAQLQTSLNGARIDGHLGLKGVLITPGEGCESLSFFFDREGSLRSPVSTVLILNGKFKPEQANVSVKTQFTSPEVHVWIIGLLKYLKERYISNLEVSDEGEYWETGDINTLREKMALIDGKLGDISRKLSSGRFSDVTGLSADQIATKIEQLLFGSHGDSRHKDGRG